MLLKMMNKMDKFEQRLEQNQIETKLEFQEMREQFQDIRKDREQDRKKFNSSMERSDEKLQDMGKQLEQKLESLHNEMKQDLKVEFQQVRGEVQEETSSAQPSETKVTSSKKRRIRKIRLLKSLCIKISKFRKRQEQAIRLGQVRNSSDCHIIKCKRNTLTKRKTMKPQSELTKNNRKFRHPAFRTNPSQVETNMFQAKHHKIKSKKGSLFGKTQNTCVGLTRRLGEHLGTKCCKCKENSSFQSDKVIEKLTKGLKVKGKCKPKISVERQSQNCTNCQMLQSLF
jgi:hypothetical protein